MTTIDPPIRLLHVDDEPVFSDLLVAFLDRADQAFEIHAESDPEQALARLEEDPYDVVVSDYDMPALNGIELLGRVRAVAPQLPFVLFTGKGSEEIASDAIAAGVSDYLQKGPGDAFTILANRVRNLVSQYRAERNLERYANQQQILAELARSALDFDVDTLLTTVVDSVARGLDVEYCKVLEAVDDDRLLLREGVGWRPGLVGETTVGTGSNSQAGYALAADGPVVVTNLATEDRFSGSSLLTDHDVVGGISVTIGASVDRWGVLGAHTSQCRQFTDDDVRFLDTVANILSTALDRQEYHQTLETQADLFEKAQDLAHVGAWEWDLRTNDGFWTPEMARIHGLPETNRGGSLEQSLDQYHPDDRATVETAFARAVAEGEPYDLEVRLIQVDGDLRWVRTRGEPQCEDGELVRIRGTLQDVTDHKERELRLTKMVEVLQQGYRVTTDADATFAEKLQEVLELGRTATDLSCGFLTAIDSDRADGPVRRIEYASGAHEDRLVGDTCPLVETYCREVVEGSGLLAIHDVAETGWAQDPASERSAFRSYIGTTVYVNDEVYGTLCFASDSPRDRPFSDAAQTVVMLMGEWAGYELEREMPTASLA